MRKFTAKIDTFYDVYFVANVINAPANISNFITTQITLYIYLARSYIAQSRADIKSIFIHYTYHNVLNMQTLENARSYFYCFIRYPININLSSMIYLYFCFPRITGL